MMVPMVLFSTPGDSSGSPQSNATIVEEWASVRVPAPPELKAVAVDPGSTALLILDIQKGNCSRERRPRCVASLPRIQDLLTKARDKGMTGVYSLTSSATPADIREEVAPAASEPVVASGVDKFFRTELEDILKGKGIQTVIIVGTSAHGAVLNTATGAALRGFSVIVPVDGMSASEPYAEQYTAWHLANGPGTRRRTTLTRTDLIAL